ncbi:RNA polymerase sigma factor, partial [Clostridium chrysemydis]|uniref:RNA polymerase sigma factor n=1 Tax=Clostridium chrysemydis TaxID=2665504 RepID=UPI003F2C9D93
MSNLEIEKLIDEYGRIIFRFCLKITKSRVEAEDIYQQTFLKALELKEKISFDNNPKSYLISIAINIY